jgi:cobalt-zinc-cadmium resistance protein CzcA
MLTLFILPAFYYSLESWIEKRRGISKKHDGR